MKTKLFFTTLLVFISIAIMAQMPVATLEHNGQTSVHYGSNAFIDAYNTAVNSNSILLSAGGFEAPSFIEKSLIVIGAGYQQDSSSMIKTTFIITPINFSNVENVHFEGVYMNSGMGYYDSIQNVQVKRCQINGVFFSNGCNVSLSSIEECVLTSTVSVSQIVGECEGFLLKQNIFYSESYITFLNYANDFVIDNNIFIKTFTGSSSAEMLENCSGNVFRNNIFVDLEISPKLLISGLGGGNIFYNNLTNCDSNTLSSVNIGSNNYFNVPVEDIFVQAIGEYDYVTNSFQLQNPETYLGTDGTQVGLYGTAIPFKENRFPSNPIVTSAEVAPQTDGSGHLNVSFTVEAQEK